MINTLFGIKKEMTSTYDTRGRRVGATAIVLNPNLVTQIKLKDKDGYEAIQLGVENKKNINKPQLGHLKKAGVEKPVRWMREIRIKELESRIKEEMEPGQEIKIDQVFSIGDSVKVTGVSKGRGFQGGVRRHGFHGGPKTHGQSDRHRAPGSIGSGTTPGRVYKGKRMAGHMGVDQVSIKGLEVVGVDKSQNLLLVKGGIPGAIGGLIRVEKVGRVKGFTPPPEEKPEEEVEGKEEQGKTDEVGSQQIEQEEKIEGEKENAKS